MSLFNFPEHTQNIISVNKINKTSRSIKEI